LSAALKFFGRFVQTIVLWILPLITLFVCLLVERYLGHQVDSMWDENIILAISAACVVVNPLAARIPAWWARVVVWCVGFVVWIPALVFSYFVMALALIGAPGFH
jgi:hypothetical protein